ncbi:hypothetical protein CYMTET_9863 [Cymbomonas tetramitiformis]|uniref:Uncharacterized protein n=1 Tax=Cymbomonas tetramitiformis TaxID=36881 RepID=A0AAE0LF20_9CHLO|nr:hypothetical protein CYMTET_9863 [Cymbomonas tetramitiformis]
MHVWREAHTTWTEENPGYQLRYWSMNDARRYLASRHPPIYLRTFDCMRAYATKADFFRYTLLHDEGGWYSDWKQVCLKTGLLDSLLATGKRDFFFFDTLREDLRRRGRRVMNAFFGTEGKSLILKSAIERSILNIARRSYDYPNVLHVAGPGMLGEVYARGEHQTNISKHDYYLNNFFYYDGERVVQHKCDACTKLQNWTHGNNYNTLWGQKKFYCL